MKNENPSNQMPREKLIEHGAEALSVNELLAIILNTGYKGESVLELAKRLIREYGSNGIKDIKDVTSLRKATGLPEVKACQLVACFQLGRIFFEKRESENQSRHIRSPQDIFEFLPDMRSLRKEQLRGVYLNARNRVIHTETISIGTITSNLVHPQEVFRPAIEFCAVGVIVVHNHPSGDPAPSDEDIAITQQLCDAGKILGTNLIDHIIIAENSWTSLKEEGAI